MNHLLGTAAAMATAVLWGSNHVVSRGVRDLLALPAFAFWRWFIALFFLTLIARSEIFQSRSFLLNNRKQIAVSGIAGVGFFSYFLLGGAYLSPAVEVGLLNATTPIWVLLIGVYLGVDKAGVATWSGLLIALCGTGLVIAHGDMNILTQMNYNIGNFLTLSAAIVFAWFSIQIRIMSKDCSVLVLTIATAWAGMVFVLLPAYLLSVVFGEPVLLKTEADSLAAALSALLYVSLIPTMIGNLLFIYGIKAIGPTKTSVFLYLSPVFSALFAVVFLHESLDWYHIAGFVIIIAGLVIVSRTKA